MDYCQIGCHADQSSYFKHVYLIKYDYYMIIITLLFDTFSVWFVNTIGYVFCHYNSLVVLFVTQDANCLHFKQINQELPKDDREITPEQHKLFLDFIMR